MTKLSDHVVSQRDVAVCTPSMFELTGSGALYACSTRFCKMGGSDLAFALASKDRNRRFPPPMWPKTLQIWPSSCSVRRGVGEKGMRWLRLKCAERLEHGFPPTSS